MRKGKRRRRRRRKHVEDRRGDKGMKMTERGGD